MRIASGVEGFDQVAGGGLPRDRLYAVCGPPGSGKTTFCCQFAAEGARQGETALFVSMQDTKADLKADMAGFDFGFDRLVDTEAISFLDAFSSDGKRFLGRRGDHHSPNGVSTRLVSFVNSRAIDRVVLDSTMLLRHLLDESDETVIEFLTALKRCDATVCLAAETTDPDAYEPVHYLAHGVVFLHNYLEDGGMTRGLQVLKLRGTDVDTDIHELSFGSAGLTVGGATPLTH